MPTYREHRVPSWIALPCHAIERRIHPKAASEFDPMGNVEELAGVAVLTHWYRVMLFWECCRNKLDMAMLVNWRLTAEKPDLFLL